MATITTELRKQRHEIDVFSIGCDGDIALEEAESYASPEEQARAARFVFPEHRDRFLRGRGYLRRRLAGILGIRISEVELAFGSNGKPGLAGTDVAFNMSHSGDRAVLVTTRGGSVGIDIETLDRRDGLWDDLQGLAAICMTQAEQDLLASLPGHQKRRRFLEFWTAKEARMKLTGEGLTLDPATISLKLRDDRPEGFTAPRVEGCETRFICLPWPDAVSCLVSAPGASAVRTSGVEEFSHERP